MLLAGCSTLQEEFIDCGVKASIIDVDPVTKTAGEMLTLKCKLWE